MSFRRAVIDVGTNSVKLLVADVSREPIHPVLEIGEQTRLGQGFYQTHQLQPEAIARTAATVVEFARRAREAGADEVRVFATSAARDACNAAELVEAIHAGTGLDLAIIAGDTEAEWAFRGATAQPALTGAALLLLDVGGGSSEFVLGCGQHRHFSRSFPLGTVRTLEALPHSDPPTRTELEHCRTQTGTFLRSQVEPGLADALHRERVLAGGNPLWLVATGGTAGILAAMELRLTHYDRERIEGLRLAYGVVQSWVARLWSLPLAQRRELPGLPPARADVMLAGGVIFEQVMQVFDFAEMRVSTRGLRFAALTELWAV